MMKRRLICRSNEHKLITFCSQQLLQLVPWQNGGYLWGSHNGHLIHWFDCAKQARLYLIVTELHGGGFSPISFCAWLMLKKLHYQKLLVLSLGQYLHIYSHFPSSRLSIQCGIPQIHRAKSLDSHSCSLDQLGCPGSKFASYHHAPLQSWIHQQWVTVPKYFVFQLRAT